MIASTSDCSSVALFRFTTSPFCAALADVERRRAGHLVGAPCWSKAAPCFFTADELRAREQRRARSGPGRSRRSARSCRRSASRCSRCPGSRRAPAAKSNALFCLRGGEHRVAAALRVGADELEHARLDLHLPGLHVLRDQVGHDGRLELAADRALEVDVLDERDRRLRRAERHAVLRDALEAALRRRSSRAARSRASRPSGASSSPAAAARERDREADADRRRARRLPPRDREHARVGLPAPRRRPSRRTGGGCGAAARRACFDFLPLGIGGKSSGVVPEPAAGER